MPRFKPFRDEKIGNKYILKEFLGDGSYGYVWRSLRLEDGKEVALKIPKNQESGDKILREGEKLLGNHHPNIIEIYWMDRVEKTGTFVIEMEYFKSHTLADEIKRNDGVKPRLFSEIYKIFFQVLEAIQFMHSLKLCHGDIKPDNILLGDKNRVKVTDFGTSKLIEDVFVETLGAGTFGFIAPEVACSNQRYLSSDIYSLGALLYFLLTGERVYDSLNQVLSNVPYKKPREINSDLPETVEKVILKSLVRDPENRYHSIKEFRAELKKAINAQSNKTIVRNYNFKVESKDWIENVTELYKKEQWRKAELLLKQQKLDGNLNSDIKLHQAYVQYRQGNFYNSLKILNEIVITKVENIRQDVFKENLYYLKARVFTNLKRYEEALDLYNKLYDSNKNLKYKYRLAIINGLCNNLDTAIELLEEINQEEPGRLIILKKLAYAYDQQKEFNKARGFFKFVNKLDPEDEKIKDKLGIYDRLL
ncbi:MAG: protein kinase domain-containing protein [Halanaerobiales bacterium]